MRWRILAVLITLSIALTILFISILRTASSTPSFSMPPPLDSIQLRELQGQQFDIEKYITYKLVNPGSVLPDHPLWFMKAVRDKIWYLVTPSNSKKAELNLLFADKRLASAIELFEKGDYETGFSTLSKGEYYLKLASDMEVKNRQQGYDTTEFLLRLANASLKHRYEIEKLIIVAPEDARPLISQTQDFSKKVFEDSTNALNSLGVQPPFNPFDGIF